MNKKLSFDIVLFSLFLLLAYAVATSSNASQSSSPISSSSSSRSSSLSSSRSSNSSSSPSSRATLISSDGAFTIDNIEGITENVDNSASIAGLVLEASKVTFKSVRQKQVKKASLGLYQHKQ